MYICTLYGTNKEISFPNKVVVTDSSDRCSYLSQYNQSQHGAKAHKLKSDQNGVKCTHSHMQHTTTLHWLSVTAFLMYCRSWWRWSWINCQHSVGGAQPQCEACNLEAAAVQGQTSGWGGQGSPPSRLEGGHDRTGEERRREKRLGGNATGSLISVAQMSSWWGLITWAWWQLHGGAGTNMLSDRPAGAMQARKREGRGRGAKAEGRLIRMQNENRRLPLTERCVTAAGPCWETLQWHS